MNSPATPPLGAVVPFRVAPLAPRRPQAAHSPVASCLSPAAAAHAAAQEAHFIRRARERFGLTISPKRYRYWIEKVEKRLPGTEFLHGTDDPQRTVWRIRSGSYTLHVLYDARTARLVTCYPPPVEQLSRKRAHRLRTRTRFVDTDYYAKRRRLAAA
jgi:hypothetical protein